jgi:uncharacterized protein (DUF4415 family)
MTRRGTLKKTVKSGRGASGVRARNGTSKARVRRARGKGFSPKEPKGAAKSANVDLEMYRPLKKPITVRIDADVLAWFKKEGSRYQTRINSALRRVMEQEKKASA